MGKYFRLFWNRFAIANQKSGSLNPKRSLLTPPTAFIVTPGVPHPSNLSSHLLKARWRQQITSHCGVCSPYACACPCIRCSRPIPLWPHKQSILILIRLVDPPIFLWPSPSSLIPLFECCQNAREVSSELLLCPSRFCPITPHVPQGSLLWVGSAPVLALGWEGSHL